MEPEKKYLTLSGYKCYAGPDLKPLNQFKEIIIYLTVQKI